MFCNFDNVTTESDHAFRTQFTLQDDPAIRPVVFVGSGQGTPYLEGNVVEGVGWGSWVEHSDSR